MQSYALGELPTAAERITTVRQLWALTSDLLVRIRPLHKIIQVFMFRATLNMFYLQLIVFGTGHSHTGKCITC